MRFFCLSLFRWLNLLSLDVVLIALAWQEAFARAAAVTLKWEERALLGVSIWMVYVVDHFLDVMIVHHCSNKAPRHHLVRSHGLLLGCLLVLAILMNLWLFGHVSWSLLRAGIVLSCATAGYLLLNHLLLRSSYWFKGREILISLIFSVGCALVPIVQSDRPWLLLPLIIAFAVIAFINCTLIARMERNIFIFQLAPRWTFSPRLVLGSCLLMIGVAFFSPAIVRAFCWALLGLAIIPFLARRFGYEVASLATDQVLFFAALFSLIR